MPANSDPYAMDDFGEAEPIVLNIPGRGYRVNREPIDFDLALEDVTAALRGKPFSRATGISVLTGMDIYKSSREMRLRYLYAPYSPSTETMPLPDNNANYCFLDCGVPDSMQLSPFFNKITPDEFLMIKGAYKKAFAEADATSSGCSLSCCILSIILPCCICWHYEDTKAKSMTDSLICTASLELQLLNRQFAARGMAIEFTASPRGAILQILPILADGNANPNWTGPVPVMDPGTLEVFRLHYTALASPFTSATDTKDVEWCTAMLTALDSSNDNLNMLLDRQDDVRALARMQEAIKRLAGFDPRFQPIHSLSLQPPDPNTGMSGLHRAAAQVGEDPAMLLAEAANDFAMWYTAAGTGNLPQEVLSRLQNPMTDLATAAQTFQFDFLLFCGFEPPPAFNPDQYVLPWLRPPPASEQDIKMQIMGTMQMGVQPMGMQGQMQPMGMQGQMQPGYPGQYTQQPPLPGTVPSSFAPR